MTTPILGSLVVYDQLTGLHSEAVTNYKAARTEVSARFWCREVEAAEQMLRYCPEHWAVVEAVRIVGEAQSAR